MNSRLPYSFHIYRSEPLNIPPDVQLKLKEQIKVCGVITKLLDLQIPPHEYNEASFKPSNVQNKSYLLQLVLFFGGYCPINTLHVM